MFSKEILQLLKILLPLFEEPLKFITYLCTWLLVPREFTVLESLLKFSGAVSHGSNKMELASGNGSSLTLEKYPSGLVTADVKWYMTLQAEHFNVWCLCLSIGTSVIIFVLLVLFWQNNREISSQCMAYYNLLWLHLLCNATPIEVKRLLLGKLQNTTMWCTAGFFQLHHWPSFIHITTLVRRTHMAQISFHLTYTKAACGPSSTIHRLPQDLKVKPFKVRRLEHPFWLNHHFGKAGRGD